MNVVRKYVAGTDPRERVQFYCPGCECTHEVPVTGQGAWQWNGSLSKPTLRPSLLMSYQRDGQRVVLCHMWVTDGEIEYLPDSGGHQLRGKFAMVEMHEC